MVVFFDIISLSLVTAKFATYRAHYEATSSIVGFLITNSLVFIRFLLQKVHFEFIFGLDNIEITIKTRF